MAVKTYPFNVEKHAHDIELRRNRAYLEDKTELFERLTGLLDALRWGERRGNIVWLNGKDYGLAKECVVWADNFRTWAKYNNKH